MGWGEEDKIADRYITLWGGKGCKISNNIYSSIKKFKNFNSGLKKLH